MDEWQWQGKPVGDWPAWLRFRNYATDRTTQS